MRARTFFDLLLIAAVFWGVWSLRFLDVGNIGVWTMGVGGVLGVAIIKMRGERLADYGLKFVGGAGANIARAAEFAGLIFVFGVIPIAIFTALGHPPQTSVVITDQPDQLVPFLIDLVIGGWVAAGIGEEFFFRGLLLRKFEQFFGMGGFGAALAIPLRPSGSPQAMRRKA